MYRSVESVLTLNAASWTGLPAFESAAMAFSQKLVQLIAAGNTQNTLTSGISRHKQELRLTAATAVGKIAKILRAYAMDNGLIELDEGMKISSSRLLHESEEDGLQLMDFVLVTANAHISNLADYGLVPADVTEAENACQEFRAILVTPRSAIVSRKEITRTIDALASELDALLRNKLDLLMEVKESSDATFFRAYRDARMVLGYGGSHGTSDENPAA